MLPSMTRIVLPRGLLLVVVMLVLWLLGLLMVGLTIHMVTLLMQTGMLFSRLRGFQFQYSSMLQLPWLLNSP
jgi:hypothetical protein